MSYSISPTTIFAQIDWDTFENRPLIDKSMPICDEKDWYEDAKCCIGAGSMNYVVEIAESDGLGETPEAMFLKQQPCINGLEIDYFVDMLDRMGSRNPPEEDDEPKWPNVDCITKPIFEGLMKILPQPLIEVIRPYVCREF